MLKGELMVTTDLKNWIPSFKGRGYVAEIDLSRVDRKDYRQVSRGFGNEFIVTDTSKARVVRVFPVGDAMRVNRYNSSKLPRNMESLKRFYEEVVSAFAKSNKPV
jgi:hypothetical protein